MILLCGAHNILQHIPYIQSDRWNVPLNCQSHKPLLRIWIMLRHSIHSFIQLHFTFFTTHLFYGLLISIIQIHNNVMWDLQCSAKSSSHSIQTMVFCKIPCSPTEHCYGYELVIAGILGIISWDPSDCKSN